jgi:dihydropteroate synthase
MFFGDGCSTKPAPGCRALPLQARNLLRPGHIRCGRREHVGSEPLSAAEELRRVLPVVQALAAEFDLPISVDTYKAAVAEAALQAGAHLINDVWGLRADPDLAGVAARYKAPVILMHNRSSWAHAEIKDRLGGRYVGMAYDDLLADGAITAER